MKYSRRSVFALLTRILTVGLAAAQNISRSQRGSSFEIHYGAVVD